MRALVIGGDGKLGGALVEALGAGGHEVVATTRRAGSEGATSRVPVDLASLPDRLLPAIRDCDVIFLCAAMTGFAACEAAPEQSQHVNVDAPKRIAAWAADADAHLVFLSTSAVFNGNAPDRAAGDDPDGPSLYGRQKAEAEQIVLDVCAGATILRLSKVLTPDDALFKGWIEALSAGDPVCPIADKTLAPVARDHAIEALTTLAARRMGGVFQLSSAHDITYTDAALHIADRLGCGRSRITPRQNLRANVPAGADMRYSTLRSTAMLDLLGRAPLDPLAEIDVTFGWGG